MRKILIDTDTGSDDAVALVMALRDPQVEVVAFTTVSGNVEVDLGTINCLQSIEYAGTYTPPVYKGCAKPLCCDLETADQVHGMDGMGDCPWLRKPTLKEETEHGVSAMLRIIKEGDGDIEILALGPLTNLAMAMLQEPDTMKKVPHITIMGGAHPYSNAHTVSAEFNIMCDPEAADIVFKFGVPFTLVTLEACWGDMRFDEADIARFKNANELGMFCMDSNRTMIDLAKELYGEGSFDLPDPAAFATMTRPDLIKTRFDCYCAVELCGTYTRGATIFIEPTKRFVDAAFGSAKNEPNCTVVTALYGDRFKDYLYELITK